VQIEIIWIISATYVLLSLLVSFHVVRRDDLEPAQKVAQSIVIWVIPFIAAIGIWLFHRSEDKVNARIDSFAKSSRGDTSVSSTFTGGGSSGSD
jgi:hypothetical protein